MDQREQIVAGPGIAADRACDQVSIIVRASLSPSAGEARRSGPYGANRRARWSAR